VRSVLVEEAPVALVVSDREGFVRLANAAAAALFGHSPGELEGKPLATVLPRGAERRQVGLRKDGSGVPVEVRIKHIDYEGERCSVSVILDVTERTMAEERLRSVVEAAPNAMVMVDEKARITLVNAQTERLFGYSRDELLGRPVERLIPARFAGTHVAQRDAFLSAPDTRAMGAGRDLYGLRKDGTEIPIEIGLNPLEMDGRRFVLATIIDITERKAAESRLSAIVEASPNAMILVDKDARIALVNAQTERLFGYGRAELLDKPVEMLIPERFGTHVAQRNAFLAAPSAREMGAGRDLYGRRKDASEVPIEIGLNPLELDGQRYVLAAIIDITERKAAAETRLASVVEAAPNAMILVDAEARIALVNAQAERLFGYTRDELLAQHVEKLIPKRFQGTHVAHRNAFLAAPSAREMGAGRELFGLRKDAAEVPIEIGLNPLQMDGKQYVLAAIIDITERKGAESRLGAVVEAAPSAMVLLDSRGRIALANAQAERMFGYRRQELLGSPVEKLVPKRFRDIHVAQRDGFLSAPSRRAMGAGRDLFGVRKNGTELPIEIGLSPMRQGEQQFVLASIIDISERKRAERLRRRYTEFSEQALAATDVAVLLQEAAHMVARSLDIPLVRMGEIEPDHGDVVFSAGVGNGADDLARNPVRRPPSSQSAHAIRTSQPVLVESYDDISPFSPPTDFGTGSIASSATVPIRGKGTVVGLLSLGSPSPRKFSQDEVSFLLDVGNAIGNVIDRDRRDRRIAQLNVELQHRYDELESFSFSVAHDLRAPLRSIAGFASALEEDFSEQLGGDAKRFIDRIVAGANQMSGLIDALLSLSRVSRQEFSATTVDMSALAESVVTELRSADPDRKVDVSIQPGVRVEGDAPLLRGVLQNLINNAWKFTRDRENARIAFSARREGDEEVFSVADNGVGFKTEYPDELFVPFRRLHGKAFEGTGIGLATVARIVRRHGGRVWAESSDGTGAQFHFTLGGGAS